MSHARETTLTVFIVYLSPLMFEVYLLVNLLKNPSIMPLGVFLVFFDESLIETVRKPLCEPNDSMYFK